MTANDKKEWLANLMADFCIPCNAEDGCENCEYLQAMNEIADAVDKSDKYRWHDLRKNPDDLPKSHYGFYLIALECSAGKYGHFISIVNWVKGKWEIDGDTVIAWKEIEPFEEGDADDSK